MWCYVQRTGQLLHDGQLTGTGYSGHGDGKNNPDMQKVHDVGPIPCGDYSIGPPHDTTTHGPYVMALTAKPGTDTFGRSGFLMHGDSKENPGTASLGCIIQARPVREIVGNSGDPDLQVVAEQADANVEAAAASANSTSQ